MGATFAELVALENLNQIFAVRLYALQSRGSLEELIDDLNVCEDEKYMATENVGMLKQQGWRVRQLLDDYIRYLRQQTNSPASRVKEEELLQSTHE